MKGKLLVVNFGRVFEVSFVEGMKTIESEILPDAGGDEFDKIFAEWLMHRVGETDERTKKFYIEEAEKIKIALSETSPPDPLPINGEGEQNVSPPSPFMGREGSGVGEVLITRADFERLIRFHVRRAAHLIDSMAERHRPEKILAFGGCCKIPLVRDMLQRIGAETPSVGYAATSLQEGGFRERKAPLIEGGCPKGRGEEGQGARQNFDELERKLAEIKKRLPPRQGESLVKILSAAKKFDSLEIAEILEKAISEITLSI